ncbi:MAG: hypothetical protein JO360_01280 [Acidobacteria bacterium]|nr:hypothetical protein [Acidobacteriota bacterium]
MSKSTAQEWIVFLSFFLVIAVYTFAEAYWLSRKGGATFARTFGFSVLTNLIGYSVGFFVLFIVLGVLLAMAWDGSIQKFPLHDTGLVIALVFGFLSAPVLLTLCKRAFLAIFKIRTSGSAWLFALSSSFLGVIASLGAPILLVYLFSR